jgi:hypothetical protein
LEELQLNPYRPRRQQMIREAKSRVVAKAGKTGQERTGRTIGRTTGKNRAGRERAGRTTGRTTGKSKAGQDRAGTD